jgi:hypothetical protein
MVEKTVMTRLWYPIGALQLQFLNKIYYINYVSRTQNRGMLEFFHVQVTDKKEESTIIKLRSLQTKRHSVW